MRSLKVEPDNLIEAQRTSATAAAELDHDDWKRARPVALSRYWSGAAAPPERHAEARLLWTDAALHIRFVCRQDEPLVVSPRPQLRDKTIGLWDRDVCEIFVAPDAGRPHRYLEFEAAPTGEWLDLVIEHRDGARHTEWDFHSGMTAAARIEAGLITIAICVPWTAFGKRPQPGERWRANLFRCVGREPTRGYLTWQPTRVPEPNFHVPQVFGWIEFRDEG